LFNRLISLCVVPVRLDPLMVSLRKRLAVADQCKILYRTHTVLSPTNSVTLKDGLKYLPLFGSYFRQVLSGVWHSHEGIILE